MEDFALVEADFQQYYQLDVSLLGYLRYGRLFANLPSDSRIMKKLYPAGSWSWDDEVNSRILLALSNIYTVLYNTNRKKGAKAQEPDEQFQPDYVKEAKEDLRAQNEREEDFAATDDFWRARNPDATYL